MSLTMIVVAVIVVIVVIALLILLHVAMSDVVTEEKLEKKLRKVHRSLLEDVTEQFTKVHRSVQTLDNRGHRRRLEGLLGNLEELFRDEHLERLRADLAAAGNLRDDARADRGAWRAEIRELRKELHEEARADRRHFQDEITRLRALAKINRPFIGLSSRLECGIAIIDGQFILARALTTELAKNPCSGGRARE